MKPESDAKGQYGKSRAKPQPDGVISAKPTVITGSQDATVNKAAPGEKKRDDWNINFDETAPDRS